MNKREILVHVFVFNDVREKFHACFYSCFQKKEVTAEYAQLLQDIEPSMYNLSAVAMLLKYLSKSKDQDLLTKLKVQLSEKS